MFGTTPPLIICFIHRNTVQFFSFGSGVIVSMDIPATAISNLEVVNKDELYVFINEWLKRNTIGGDRMLFVLSGATYFDRQIEGADESGQETQILKFYDTVPFEELITKVVPVNGGKHVFAVNKPYLEAIQHAFYLQGIQSTGVIPAFVLGPHSAKQRIDPEMGTYIIKHADTFSSYSLSDAQDMSASTIAAMPTSSIKKSNTRMMAMVGIFSFLVLVLIVMLLTR